MCQRFLRSLSVPPYPFPAETYHTPQRGRGWELRGGFDGVGRARLQAPTAHTLASVGPLRHAPRPLPGPDRPARGHRPRRRLRPPGARAGLAPRGAAHEGRSPGARPAASASALPGGGASRDPRAPRGSGLVGRADGRAVLRHGGDRRLLYDAARRGRPIGARPDTQAREQVPGPRRAPRAAPEGAVPRDGHGAARRRALPRRASSRADHRPPDAEATAPTRGACCDSPQRAPHPVVAPEPHLAGRPDHRPDARRVRDPVAPLVASPALAALLLVRRRCRSLLAPDRGRPRVPRPAHRQCDERLPRLHDPGGGRRIISRASNPGRDGESRAQPRSRIGGPQQGGAASGRGVGPSRRPAPRAPSRPAPPARIPRRCTRGTQARTRRRGRSPQPVRPARLPGPASR